MPFGSKERRGGEEHVWGGMLNIGLRPTMGKNSENRTIEVHLLDFAGDLYGCRLTLSFVRRLGTKGSSGIKGSGSSASRGMRAMVRMIFKQGAIAWKGDGYETLRLSGDYFLLAPSFVFLGSLVLFQSLVCFTKGVCFGCEEALAASPSALGVSLLLNSCNLN